MLLNLMPIVRFASGLILSKDGSLSLTKLGAATFHAGLAFHVNRLQWDSATFLWDAWVLYAGFAVGHAQVDKGMAMLKAYKEQAAQAPRNPSGGAPIGTTPPQG